MKIALLWGVAALLGESPAFATATSLRIQI